MTQLNDILINRYRSQTDMEKGRNTELSEQFHTIFRETFARGKLRGDIEPDPEKPPVPDFWNKWGQLQEKGEE